MSSVRERLEGVGRNKDGSLPSPHCLVNRLCMKKKTLVEKKNFFVHNCCHPHAEKHSGSSQASKLDFFANCFIVDVWRALKKPLTCYNVGNQLNVSQSMGK